eukprot:GHVU01118343.1.p1 GENE.GHVU01118343.1~~GHVU01118343.1.p1  ORF type:complete len:320 (-),score=71.17 GHVU01118343.1:22-927(-)
MSPDTLQRCYSNKCDMWSLGVIVYMLLAGDPPFHATTNDGLRGAILKGNFHFDAGPWTEVSAAAKDFVHALLTVDPAVRLSAKQALQHEWLVRLDSEGCNTTVICRDVLTGIRAFVHSTSFRRAALLVMAYALPSEEIRGLHQTFLELDSQGDGHIPLADLVAYVENSSCARAPAPEIQRFCETLRCGGSFEYVNYTEFLAAMLSARHNLHENLIRSAFHQFDTDNSGFISRSDLEQLLAGELSEEEIAAVMSQFDRSGNGIIDYEEFLLAVRGSTSALIATPLDFSRECRLVAASERVKS